MLRPVAGHPRFGYVPLPTADRRRYPLLGYGLLAVEPPYPRGMAASQFTQEDLIHGESSRRTWDAMLPDQQQTLLQWINAPRWKRSRRTRAKDAQFALASYPSHVEPPTSIQNLADIMVGLNLVS